MRPAFSVVQSMILINNKPKPESIAAAMCEIRTLFLARYIAMAEGRDPGIAVQECAKRLIGRVKGYPAFDKLLKNTVAAPTHLALKRNIETEINMRVQGVF